MLVPDAVDTRSSGYIWGDIVAGGESYAQVLRTYPFGDPDCEFNDAAPLPSFEDVKSPLSLSECLQDFDEGLDLDGNLEYPSQMDVDAYGYGYGVLEQSIVEPPGEMLVMDLPVPLSKEAIARAVTAALAAIRST